MLLLSQGARFNLAVNDSIKLLLELVFRILVPFFVQSADLIRDSCDASSSVLVLSRKIGGSGNDSVGDDWLTV